MSSALAQLHDVRDRDQEVDEEAKFNGEYHRLNCQFSGAIYYLRLNSA
jgi:hypothetical protein